MILCLLAAGVTCRAQYHPQYSQYVFNGLALNPAYAGSEEVLSLSAFYRTSQWGNSVEGAPATQTFSGDFPLRNPQIALGLLVFNDQISIFRQTGAYAAYVFRVRAGEGKLSFGLQAGFDLQREDETGISIIQNPDPLFSPEIHSTFMPNAGVGAYYYTSKYFAGLSLPRLLAYSPNTADSYKGKLTFSNTMLYGGVIIPAGRDFKIKPSTLLQYAGKGILFDLNCSFLILRERLELGVSYRNSSTLVGMAQFRINQLRIGYAYDCALGKPSVINTSHEIMLRYDFKFRVKAVSPLYLK
jgi:type IX secretion system PorP/SprF family membrane protein